MYGLPTYKNIGTSTLLFVTYTQHDYELKPGGDVLLYSESEWVMNVKVKFNNSMINQIAYEKRY